MNGEILQFSSGLLCLHQVIALKKLCTLSIFLSVLLASADLINNLLFTIHAVQFFSITLIYHTLTCTQKRACFIIISFMHKGIRSGSYLVLRHVDCLQKAPVPR